MAALPPRCPEPYRAVECPADIIDALGGCSTDGVGQAYGKGHDLQIKSKWMRLM